MTEQTFRPNRDYGHCRTCNGLGVYLDHDRKACFFLNGDIHAAHPVDFYPDESLGPGIPKPQADPVPAIGKVKVRCTEAGTYYSTQSLQEELFVSVQDENEDPQSEATVAKKLGVDITDITAARHQDVCRPTTFKEIADVEGSTIRRDQSTELILTCGGILTFTDEDQMNILMSGESAGGKSYIALEVAAYFPGDIVQIIATASPTSFIHDAQWDDEAKVLRKDLRQKLIIFLDQPHYQLMEKLRPLLSHDRRELLYKTTDKSKRGSLRTKNTIITGYPTVFFCAAKLSLDEQERTRVFILSPQTSQDKLEESVRLRITKDGNREAFKDWIALHPRRRWLKARIEAIRAAKIDQVIIEEQDLVYAKFMETHKRLAPRHQRDVGRILALIKAHALLNFWDRERRGEHTIVATNGDIEAGFGLYSEIAKANELGLAPQLYEIYDTVIRPHLDPLQSLRKDVIAAAYQEQYGRPLPWRKLDREILPALEASGLIGLEPDPADRRRMVVCPPYVGSISELAPQNNIAKVVGTPPPVQGPLDTIMIPSQPETAETKTNRTKEA
jgi:hypothetical protein